METTQRWTIRACETCGEASNRRRFLCEMCGGTLGNPLDVIPVPAPDEERSGLVSNNHGATAREAALKVRPRTGSQRHRVLMHIEECGRTGATRDEIAHALGVSPNTVRPRVRELMQGGHVGVSDTLRRRTPLDHAAEVILAAPYLSTAERTLC